MREVSRIAALIALFCVTGSVSAAPPLSPNQRINLAATHIEMMQQQDGFFRYQFNFLTGRWSEDNNIVRQAGAGYALAEYLLAYGNATTARFVKKAIRAYRDASMQWRGGRLLTMEGNYKKAKAGATALALITALYYRDATGNEQFDDAIRAWVRGLLGLRNADGGFSRRPRKRKESPYSNGEAWLALAIYHQQFPNDTRVRDTLEELDAVFLDRYSREPDIGFFHWGLMAAGQRYRQTKQKRFVDFAVQQTQLYLDKMRPEVKINSNSCYAVEGMTAVMEMLDGNLKHLALNKRLARRIDEEMQKNLELQIGSDQAKLELGSERELRAPEITRFPGAFLNGRHRPQIRIDSTQHCLSAMVRVEQLNLAR